MSIWKKIQAHFTKKQLKKEGPCRRNPMVVNLHHARSIGFLYHSTDEATFILVKQFAEKICSLFGTRKTLALGFISQKEAPSHHSHILNSDYFTLKEINWYGYPSGLAVDTFCQEEFDILIDISDGDNAALNTIVQRSIAGFKIGKNSEQEAYDLIVPVKQGSTMDQYLSRIIQLLSNINHESSKIA